MSLFVRTAVLCLVAGALFAVGAAASTPTPQRSTTTPIEHLIVIYLENWSFDGLYGTFPGADGLFPGPGTPTPLPQANRPFGTPFPNYPLLPGPVIGNSSNGDIPNNSQPGVLDTRLPTLMPNAPFAIDTRAPITTPTGDMVHRFYNQQHQLNGGLMNQFAAYSDNPGLVLTYYDMASVPTSTPVIAHWAKQYTLADRWFHAAFGDSWHNHL